MAEKLGEEQDREGRFKVWGMTARVLVDAARVAYGEEPEMEHNLDYGDAKIIGIANELGDFDEVNDVKKTAASEDKGKM